MTDFSAGFSSELAALDAQALRRRRRVVDSPCAPELVVDSRSFRGKPYALHVFASWCYVCREESAVLARETPTLGIPMIGYDYKDDPVDAKRWLAQYGNPYAMVLADLEGDVAIDLGVGLPRPLPVVLLLGPLARLQRTDDAYPPLDGDVGAGVAVVDRRSDQVEAMLRHFRVLDVQGVGLGYIFQRERDGHAAAADGDDEARPGRGKRVIGRDEAEKARRRQIDLQPCRHEAHGARYPHSLQTVGKSDSLRDGNALRFHADRAVGDDPGTAFRADLRLLGTSGTLDGQFLFDSSRNET